MLLREDEEEFIACDECEEIEFLSHPIYHFGDRELCIDCIKKELEKVTYEEYRERAVADLIP